MILLTHWLELRTALRDTLPLLLAAAALSLLLLALSRASLLRRWRSHAVIAGVSIIGVTGIVVFVHWLTL